MKAYTNKQMPFGNGSKEMLNQKSKRRQDKMGKTQEQFLVDRRGKRTAVVIPMRQYQRLLEDLHDLAIVAERRNEPTISLDELKRRLRADGLIPD